MRILLLRAPSAMGACERFTNRGLMNAFETTLILRRLLESSDEIIRKRAVDVSLLAPVK